MPSSRHALVAAADNRYAFCLAAMLKSVEIGLDPAVSVTAWILDGGISLPNKLRIERSLDRQRLDVRWLKVSADEFQGMPVFGHASMAAYFRIVIPKMLPGNIDRAVYLDSDIVALGDIGPLWRMEMGGACLLAAQESDATLASRGIVEYTGVHVEDRHAPYLNSGVLVFDLLAWRREGLCERVFDVIRMNRERIRFWDQDGFNAALIGRWRQLAPKWNCRIDCGRPFEDIPSDDRNLEEYLRSRAVALHFASSAKPWDVGNRHPAASVFFNALDRTVWRGWRPGRVHRPSLANDILTLVYAIRGAGGYLG